MSKTFLRRDNWYDLSEYMLDMEQRLAHLEQIHGKEQPKSETWRDVTAECEAKVDGIYHQGGRLYEPDYADGYRICKVKITRFPDGFPAAQDAFIIERKET